MITWPAASLQWYYDLKRERGGRGWPPQCCQSAMIPLRHAVLHWYHDVLPFCNDTMTFCQSAKMSRSTSLQGQSDFLPACQRYHDLLPFSYDLCHAHSASLLWCTCIPCPFCPSGVVTCPCCPPTKRPQPSWSLNWVNASNFHLEYLAPVSFSWTVPLNKLYNKIV